MSYCIICEREHDERCDLCIYKDDPKSNVPESLKDFSEILDDVGIDPEEWEEEDE